MSLTERITWAHQHYEVINTIWALVIGLPLMVFTDWIFGGGRGLFKWTHKIIINLHRWIEPAKWKSLEEYQKLESKAKLYEEQNQKNKKDFSDQEDNHTDYITRKEEEIERLKKENEDVAREKKDLEDQISKQVHPSLYEIGTWQAKTKPNNPQGADYNEVSLDGDLLESISCIVVLNTDYLRFGFKLLTQKASIFDQGVRTEGDSLLMHIGKQLNDNKINATAFRGINQDGTDFFVKDYNKGEQIKVEAVVDRNNKIKFNINDETVYSTQINYDMRERIILMAWGDNNDYHLTIKNIKVKVR